METEQGTAPAHAPTAEQRRTSLAYADRTPKRFQSELGDGRALQSDDYPQEAAHQYFLLREAQIRGANVRPQWLGDHETGFAQFMRDLGPMPGPGYVLVRTAYLPPGSGVYDDFWGPRQAVWARPEDIHTHGAECIADWQPPTPHNDADSADHWKG